MKTTIKNLFAQKSTRYFFIAIVTLFVLAVVFQVGTFAGYHKAGFSRDWSDRYERNFGMPRPDSMRGMMYGGYPSAHGASGKVLTVSLPTFSINGTDGIEKTIVIGTSTIIRQAYGDISSTTIKPGDNVVILGTPNTNGQIDAKLIRVMGDATSTNGYRGMMGWMMGNWFNR